MLVADAGQPIGNGVLVDVGFARDPVQVVRGLFVSGEHYDWRIGGNYVRLDPHGTQTHVLKVL